MNMPSAIWIVSVLVLFSQWAAPVRLPAQGTRDDYQRMDGLHQSTAARVFRASVQPHWLEDGDHFWYRIQTGAAAHEFVLVDLAQGTRMAAFDHQRVAEQLTAATGQAVALHQLPFQAIQFSKNLSHVYVRFRDRLWEINRADSLVATVDDPASIVFAEQLISELPRSEDQGGEVRIEIINDSSGDVRAIWINRRGRRVPYGTIKSGQRFPQHTCTGHVWLIEDTAGTAVALFQATEGQSEFRIDDNSRLKLFKPKPDRPSPNASPRAVAPDGKHRAFVRDHQLMVRDSGAGKSRALTDNASEDNSFTERKFFWSPDSRYLVALQVQPGDERQVHMIESAPHDQVQPKLHQHTYAKPGDRIRTVRPRLFDMQTKREIPVDDQLFENPWRLRNFRWQADSSEFRFLFNQRGHQVMRIVGIDAKTGTSRALVNETSSTFIDYTNKVYSRQLDDTGELIWMSERDGWNHLYLYDQASGDVKNQITRGQWVVRGVDRIDEQQRQIWFRASGIVPGEDPYYLHHCRIDFDGSDLVMLTNGDGTHSVEYSPDRRYLIDRYSRVDAPPVTSLRRSSDGSLVCQLEIADWSALLETGWMPPVRFAAPGRDQQTGIYGVIYRPTGFDPEKKYPVIEHIYAGPHDSFAPKRFSVINQMRQLAELGFIVVQIDGMGTSNRSKAFHDVCWKNLADAGLPDRILWLTAAARQHPYMDLSRVGIYGGSAGGQSAMRALLAHGDFYKVAVADCGCHDNRMDKIWWNEQWMGWPVGDHYDEQSNVTQAHKLNGQLLLIVGELDRNVDPASTMQVVKALIQADKDFDLLVVPGAGHGVGSGRYGMRRTRDFFVRHLYGAEPRREQ